MWVQGLGFRGVGRNVRKERAFWFGHVGSGESGHGFTGVGGLGPRGLG